MCDVFHNAADALQPSCQSTTNVEFIIAQLRQLLPATNVSILNKRNDDFTDSPKVKEARENSEKTAAESTTGTGKGVFQRYDDLSIYVKVDTQEP